MKLGIYADGLGCSLTKWSYQEYKRLKSHLGPSWVEILEKDYEIINYSKQAVSFLELYDHYIKTRHNQDINILIAPTPIRVFVRALPKTFFLNPEYVCDQIKKIRGMAPYPSQEDELSILESVYVYMTRWRDLDLETQIQHMVISQCLHKDKNLYVIKGADNSVPMPGMSLEELSLQELKLIDSSFTIEKLVKDKRKCFLSLENNCTLAEIILQHIKQARNKIILTNDKIRTPGMEIEYYVGGNNEKN